MQCLCLCSCLEHLRFESICECVVSLNKIFVIRSIAIYLPMPILNGGGLNCEFNIHNYQSCFSLSSPTHTAHLLFMLSNLLEYSLFTFKRNISFLSFEFHSFSKMFFDRITGRKKKPSEISLLFTFQLSSSSHVGFAMFWAFHILHLALPKLHYVVYRCTMISVTIFSTKTYETGFSIHNRVNQSNPHLYMQKTIRFAHFVWRLRQNNKYICNVLKLMNCFRYYSGFPCTHTLRQNSILLSSAK